MASLNWQLKKKKINKTKNILSYYRYDYAFEFHYYSMLYTF